MKFVQHTDGDLHHQAELTFLPPKSFFHALLVTKKVSKVKKKMRERERWRAMTTINNSKNENLIVTFTQTRTFNGSEWFSVSCFPCSERCNYAWAEKLTCFFNIYLTPNIFNMLKMNERTNGKRETIRGKWDWSRCQKLKKVRPNIYI